MATYFIDTGGSATNSGTTDTNAATVTGSAATAATTTITLDGSPNLSFLSGRTSGTTQAAIYLNQATNTNQKIFPITGFDNTLKTVTVSVAPTGITSSAWAIDGRHVLTNASIEAAIVAGDVVQFNNSPAAQAAAGWTVRNSGSLTGFIKFIGKTGVRPILTTTGNNSPFSSNAQTNIWVENMEFQCQGGTGGGFVNNGAGCVTYNIKVTDFGTGTGVSAGNTLVSAEITGGLGDGISIGSLSCAIGINVHDCAGNGFNNTNNNTSTVLNFCTAINNGARGFYWSGAPTSQSAIFVMMNCTAYGNQNDGVTAANTNAAFRIINCITQDNGWNTSGYNVNLPTLDTLTSFHAWNIFYNSGLLGGSNLNNLVVNANVPNSEFTTNPLFKATGMGTFASTAVNTTTDAINIPSHGLVNNDKFMIQSTTGAVPTGLAVKTPYYVIVTDANNFQLTNTYNGTKIDITAQGSGTNTYSASILANLGVSTSSPAKAAGFPGAMPGSASVGALDIGAIQIQIPQTATGRFN